MHLSSETSNYLLQLLPTLCRDLFGPLLLKKTLPLQDNGGYWTSAPGECDLRFETSPDNSDLINQLAGLGRLRNSGVASRATSSGFVDVCCYALTLGK